MHTGGDPELEALIEERHGRASIIDAGRPLITPIKHGRLQQLAEMLHFRRTSLESSAPTQAPKIEAPVNPTGGEMKG